MLFFRHFPVARGRLSPIGTLKNNGSASSATSGGSAKDATGTKVASGVGEWN